MSSPASSEASEGWSGAADRRGGDGEGKLEEQWQSEEEEEKKVQVCRLLRRDGQHLSIKALVCTSQGHFTGCVSNTHCPDNPAVLFCFS